MSGTNSKENRQSAMHLMMSGRVTSVIERLIAKRSIEMDDLVEGSLVVVIVAILALEFWIKMANTKSDKQLLTNDIIMKIEYNTISLVGYQILIIVKMEKIIISSDILIWIVKGTKEIKVMFLNSIKKWIP